jgi:hypothetical protein
LIDLWGGWLEGDHVPGSDFYGDFLRIDPDAMPALRGAFVDALAKVDRQLEVAAAELRVTAWARDPVSQNATGLFNDRSVDHAESAVDTLRAYRQQLDIAVHNLDRTAEQYRAVDGDGSAGVTRNDEG